MTDPINPPPPSGPPPIGPGAPPPPGTGQPQPAFSLPLPDSEIDEIFDGLFIPSAPSIKRMAYEIKKARGDKNPGSL